ncbi:carboxy terminal-processing peptidase [Pedobacter sp. NJ-S-72]
MDKVGEDTEASALPWDEVQKSDFIAVANLTDVRAELVKLHDTRMEKSLDYKILVQDIADMKKRNLETSVTLNENENEIIRER